MTKDVLEAVKERRSVRRFRGDPIPQATIGQLLEAAILAPTAGNCQPWRFIVVHNAEVKSRLAAAAYGQDFVAEAPVVIVVCAEFMRSAQRYGNRGLSLYSLQDTAAATQNILLAATGCGLGTCWVGAFDEGQVARVLELPTDVLRPVAMIPVGYPAVKPRRPPRRPLEEIVRVIE